MFSVDVADDVHSDLPALGREGRGVRPLDRRMLPCLGGFCGIVTDLRQGGVVHRGDELARHRLGQHILPNRSGQRSRTPSVVSSPSADSIDPPSTRGKCYRYV